jgi:hypothetical protein
MRRAEAAGPSGWVQAAVGAVAEPQQDGRAQGPARSGASPVQVRWPPGQEGAAARAASPGALQADPIQATAQAAEAAG